jgi:hypothetical protein
MEPAALVLVAVVALVTLTDEEDTSTSPVCVLAKCEVKIETDAIHRGLSPGNHP